MISLLHLQEFISLTSVQGKFHASTLCFVLYIDSLYAASTLHRVSPKLHYFSICIKLMVVLVPIIPWVNPPLSSISTSTLSVSLFSIAPGCSPLNFVMHPPTRYLMQDHAMTPHHSLGPLNFVKLLSWGTHSYSLLHMILPLENIDLSLMNLFLWSNFFLYIIPSRSFKDHHLFGLLCLTEQIMHCSTIVNAFTILWLFTNIAPTVPHKT